MLTLRKVAITGGLSSGKSTVCEIFQKLGAYTVSADAVVHDLISFTSPVTKKLFQLFGEEFKKTQISDRKEIARRVFSDPKMLKQLEKILHPAVLEEIERQYIQIRDQNSHPLFVAEIPLLYETKNQKLFDYVISVYCKESNAKSRFTKQRKTTEEEFDRRMNYQIHPSEKKAKADQIIYNDGTLQELKIQVKTLYGKLTQE